MFRQSERQFVEIQRDCGEIEGLAFALHHTVYMLTRIAETLNEFSRTAASSRSFRMAMLCCTAVMLLCATGAVSLFCLQAWAEDADGDTMGQQVVQAQSSLDDAESRMSSIVAQYDELSSEETDLQSQIDQATAQALDAQSKVIEGRRQLGSSAAYEYRGGTQEMVLSLLLNSDDFDSLIRNLTYIQAIEDSQSVQIAEQKELTSTYDALIQQLNERKNQQEEKMAALQKTRDDAASVVADATAKLQDAQSDEAARVAALQQIAASLVQSDSGDGPSIDESWNTNDRPADVGGDHYVEPNPDPDPPSSNTGDATGGSSDPGPEDGGWLVGIASAYGGWSDSWTPNPGSTATGALCDDYSMGVAVPMSMPNYRQYFNRRVEISYNGMTVIATVNDCGYMGNGSRCLDLQPGVWGAFGYSSCNAWGLRTISYRFL